MIRNNNYYFKHFNMPEGENNPEIKTSLDGFRAEIEEIKNRRGQKDGTLWLVNSKELDETAYQFWRDYEMIFRDLEDALRSGREIAGVRNDLQTLNLKIKSTKKEGLVSAFMSWLGNRLAMLDTYSINESATEITDSIEVLAEEKKEVFGK
jgi:hypothetical protein